MEGSVGTPGGSRKPYRRRTGDLIDEERTIGSSAYTLSSFEDEVDEDHACQLTPEEEEIFTVAKYRSAIPFNPCIDDDDDDNEDNDGSGSISFKRPSMDQTSVYSPPSRSVGGDDKTTMSSQSESGSATLASVPEYDDSSINGTSTTTFTNTNDNDDTQASLSSQPPQLESAECRRRAMRVLRLVQAQEESSRSRFGCSPRPVDEEQSQEDESGATSGAMKPSWRQALGSLFVTPNSRNMGGRAGSDLSVTSSVSATSEMLKATAEDWKLLKECYRDLAAAIVSPAERRKLIDSLKEEPVLAHGEIDTFGWSSRT